MNRILVYGLSQDTRGGIETFLLNMNKFMSKDTIFDYVIEGNHTIHKEEIYKKGGKCFFVSPKKKIFSNLRDWKRLLKHLKDGYKIIYFNLYSLAWIFPIRIALKQGYKVIVHAHNNKLHNCGIFQRILHSLNRQYQKHLNIVRFTNSDLSSNFFFSNCKSELIYNAIDVDRFSFSKEKRERIRNTYGISNEQILFGFSGRITYQKNPLFLIDIFNEISKINSKSRFIICGEGNLLNDVKYRAKEYGIDVIFAGNNSNIEDYYQAMDCFVLPSRFEGLGIVLIEAQASGLISFTSSKVVPDIAKVTDILHYISLNNDASVWAKEILSCYKNLNNRAMYCSKIKGTHFDIVVESIELEKKLISYMD